MIKFKAFELECRYYVAFGDKLDAAVSFETYKQAREYAAIQNIYWFNQLIEQELSALKLGGSARLVEVMDYLPTNLK